VTETDWGDMAGEGFDGFELSHRDRALFEIESHHNLEAQLGAIRSLLMRNQDIEQNALKERQESERDISDNPNYSAEYREHLIDAWGEDFYTGIYQGAAHSMPAVGMLAPFIESLFVAIFERLRKQQGTDAGDTRQQRAEDQFWNPQIVFRSEGPRDDLVAGIDQLAESCGLKPFLPDDHRKTLSALFAYRNNMLHNGFEWPAETIGKFSNRIDSEKWPETWFTSAKRDGKPWIYYMSPDFCAHCVELIDGIIDGTGRYLEKQVE